MRNANSSVNFFARIEARIPTVGVIKVTITSVCIGKEKPFIRGISTIAEAVTTGYATNQAETSIIKGGGTGNLVLHLLQTLSW